MRRSTIAHILVGVLVGGCAETLRSPSESSAVAPTRAVDHGSSSVFRYPWTWLDDHGERIAFSMWRGTPLVVAAIYTTCLETCPRTIVKLRRVYDEFARSGRHAEFVVVTLDPEIDTQDRLLKFRQSHDLPASWHLLAGTREETEQLMNVLNIHVMETDVHLVHDSKIVLFDPGGVREAELGAR